MRILQEETAQLKSLVQVTLSLQGRLNNDLHECVAQRRHSQAPQPHTAWR